MFAFSKNMQYLHKVTLILLIVGGLNWLLSVFNWDLAMWLGEGNMMVANIVYVLVGLSALYEVYAHKGMCKDCGESAGVAM